MKCGICGKIIWFWQPHTRVGFHKMCRRIDAAAFNAGYNWRGIIEGVRGGSWL